MTEFTDHPFTRPGDCSCAECVRCCHEQPGALAPGDLERIAAHLGQPLRVAALKFWASKGSLLGNSQTGETLRIGSITPRYVRGRCVFLDDTDRCTIHEVAPFGCAYFDTHMGADEGRRRGLYLARVMLAPEYQSLRRTLDVATHTKPRSY